jgi:hypothetical protein
VRTAPTYMLCSPTINFRYVLNATISPSHIGPYSSITTIRVIPRRRYLGPKSNSLVTTIRVTHWRCSRAPPSPCDPEMFSQVFPTFGSNTTCQSGAAESRS